MNKIIYGLIFTIVITLGTAYGASTDKSINDLTENSSPDGSDYVPVWDTSASVTRKVNLTNALTAGGQSIFQVAGITNFIASSGGTIWLVTDDFVGAVTAAGTDDTTLLITTAQTLSGSSVSVPANVTTKFVQGGSIQGNVTVNFHGPVIAGKHQIFIGDSITPVFHENSVHEVYPEWWGGKADGTTNNTTAFSNMVSDSGTTVPMKLGIGTYLFSGTSTMVNLSGTSGTMIGSGPASILKIADSTDPNYGIYIDGSGPGFHLSNFTLDLNRANQSIGNGYGIYVRNTSDVNIERLKIINARQAGIWVTAESDENTRHVRIVNNYFDNIGLLSAIAIDGGSEILIDGNFIQNNVSATAIDIEASTGVTGVAVTNNVIRNSYAGIQLAEASLPNYYVTVDSNIISGTTGAGGIRVSGANIGAVISNNVIYDSYTDGIVFSGTPDGVLVSGNAIFNSGQEDSGTTYSGVQLGDAARSTVVGNVLRDTQSTKTQDFGIRITSSGTSNIITGNIVDGNNTSGISNQGTYIFIGMNYDGSLSMFPSGVTGEGSFFWDSPTFRVDSSGNKVYVEAAGSDNAILVLKSASGQERHINFGDENAENDGAILYRAAEQMDFRVNAATRMRIDSTGNIGIGTTSVVGGTTAFMTFASSVSPTGTGDFASFGAQGGHAYAVDGSGNFAKLTSLDDTTGEPWDEKGNIYWNKKYRRNWVTGQTLVIDTVAINPYPEDKANKKEKFKKKWVNENTVNDKKPKKQDVDNAVAAWVYDPSEAEKELPEYVKKHWNAYRQQVLGLPVIP